MTQIVDKIIFTGPMGAGKTTAITAISDTKPINTDVQCQGDESVKKPTTTVAMDYSYIVLDNGKRIHLYGTPGQQRFDFMWKILVKGGLGLVLLINNDQPNPIEQLDFYLDAFDEFIRDTAVVIGITRIDANPTYSLVDYQERLTARHQVYPIFEVDGRNPKDVKILIHALLAVLES